MVNRTPIADDVEVVGWVTENSNSEKIHSVDSIRLEIVKWRNLVRIMPKSSLRYRTLHRISE